MVSQSFDDRDEVGDIGTDEDGYIKDKGDDIIITMLTVILKVQVTTMTEISVARAETVIIIL